MPTSPPPVMPSGPPCKQVYQDDPAAPVDPRSVILAFTERAGTGNRTNFPFVGVTMVHHYMGAQNLTTQQIHAWTRANYAA